MVIKGRTEAHEGKEEEEEEEENDGAEEAMRGPARDRARSSID